MTACETSRSFERTADGSILYLDEASPAQKVEAREAIVGRLSRGLDVYDLQIGDEFEILFSITRHPTRQPYRISVADKLRIDILNQTDTGRDVQVQVRPRRATTLRDTEETARRR